MPVYTDIINGNNATGTGSIGNPYQTIRYAAPFVTAGNELLVRTGSYNEGLTAADLNNGTSWLNTVRIAAYPGEDVWLAPTSNANGAGGTGRVIWIDYDLSYIDFDGINIDGSALSGTETVVWFSTNNLYNPHHIRLQNCELIAGDIGGAGAIILGNHQVIGATGSHQIQNVEIHGGGLPGLCGYSCSSYGVYIAGPNNLVEHCDIYNTSGAAIQIYNAFPGGDPANNNIVRYNRLHDISDTGDMDHGWGIVVAGDDNQVYGNFIYRISAGTSDTNHAGIFTFYGDSNKYWNNTIYSVRTGISYSSFFAATTNTEIRNNIVWVSSLSAYVPEASDIASNNLWNTADPGFFNPALDDFRIPTAGPAYHTGTFIPIVAQDYYRNPYNNPPSMGAAEASVSTGTVIYISDNTGDIPGFQTTRIREDFPDTNFGGANIFSVENYAPGIVGHSLVRCYGLNTIAPGTPIESVVLYARTADPDGTSGADTTIELRRCLRTWSHLGATWNKYDGTNGWATPGATGSGTDISATVSATVVVPNVSGQWVPISDPQLTQDYQDMIDGVVPNDGHVWIRTDGADDGAWRVFTSEEGDDTLRIVAVITLSTSTITAQLAVTLDPVTLNATTTTAAATVYRRPGSRRPYPFKPGGSTWNRR